MIASRRDLAGSSYVSNTDAILMGQPRVFQKSEPAMPDWTDDRMAPTKSRDPKLGDLLGAIQARVSLRADATLAESRSWLCQARKVSANNGLMWKMMCRLELTYKKSLRAGQQDGQILPKVRIDLREKLPALSPSKLMRPGGDGDPHGRTREQPLQPNHGTLTARPGLRGL
jgi:hypothetical protein